MRREVHLKQDIPRIVCYQRFDKATSVVSMTSYYYTQKSRIWQGAVCGVNDVILLHTEIKDLTRRCLWCQWRHIITHRNQEFDKAMSVVSMMSYYYTQKSMIICLHHACCFIIYIIVVKIKGENLQIIGKFSYLANYDINIASYQSRNRFSFLCLYRVVIIWIISKIL
jgi:hypothetical protein